MNKELLERYRNKWITIAVPHLYEEGRYFYHSGVLSALGDKELILTKNSGEDFIISYSKIEQIQASGSAEAYGKQ